MPRGWGWCNGVSCSHAEPVAGSALRTARERCSVLCGVYCVQSRGLCQHRLDAAKLQCDLDSTHTLRCCAVARGPTHLPHAVVNQRVTVLLRYRQVPPTRAGRLLRPLRMSAGCHALAFTRRDRVLVAQLAGLPAAQRYFSVSGSRATRRAACSIRLGAARGRELAWVRTRSCCARPFAGGGFGDAGSGRPPCLRPCGGAPRLP